LLSPLQALRRIDTSDVRGTFAQKKFGFTKDVLEEAHKVMTDALSNDGFVEDRVLQSAIDEAKAVVNVTKPVSHTDVADYSFLREAIKQK
jgi:hypothetical protein